MGHNIISYHMFQNAVCIIWDRFVNIKLIYIYLFFFDRYKIDIVMTKLII